MMTKADWKARIAIVRAKGAGALEEGKELRKAVTASMRVRMLEQQLTEARLTENAAVIAVLDCLNGGFDSLADQQVLTDAVFDVACEIVHGLGAVKVEG